MTASATTLTYNPESGRYCIGDRDLHCGDCFQLSIEGQWRDVRIEHCSSDGWWLVGIPHGSNLADRYQHYPARRYS